MLSQEFKLTQEQIGQRVGLSRASVTNYMRLLRLPREVMQLLAEKKLNVRRGQGAAVAGERRPDFKGGAVCGEEGTVDRTD